MRRWVLRANELTPFRSDLEQILQRFADHSNCKNAQFRAGNLSAFSQSLRHAIRAVSHSLGHAKGTNVDRSSIAKWDPSTLLAAIEAGGPLRFPSGLELSLLRGLKSLITPTAKPPYEAALLGVWTSLPMLGGSTAILIALNCPLSGCQGCYLASESIANWRRDAGSTRQSRPTRIASPKTHT